MAISDLTGTKWLLNETILYDSSFPTYNITYKAYYNSGADYDNGTDLYMDSVGINPKLTFYRLRGTGLNNFAGASTFECIYEGENSTTMTPTSNSETLEYIEFTGGTDATNSNLISWLEANGTLQSSQLTVDMSTLTGWDALSSGTHSVQIVAKAMGYRDSEPSTAVSFTKAPSGYNVRVQGIIDAEGSVTIYDGMTSTAPKLIDYLSMSDFTFDETVLCTSGYLYVYARGCQPCYEGDGSGGVTKTGSYFTVTGDGSVTNIRAYGCFVEGTEITLADGSTKKIEDITFDDDLLVYDFYEGKFSTAKPQWISEAKTMDNYLKVSFDNGSELKVIGPGGDIGYHRIFNVEAQSFTHTGTQECQVGTTAFTDKGGFTKIVSQEVVKEDVRFFNIITDRHYNLFANGILTSCKLSNKYEIKDMKYTDKELMTEEEVNKYIDTLPYKGFKTEETQKG